MDTAVAAGSLGRAREPRRRRPELRARACGHHLGARSVDVTLHYARRVPSASLSFGHVFVARFPLRDGRIRYLVWQIMH
jgi:hypothetical protein